MFRMNNKSRKRPTKGQHSNQMQNTTENKIEYTEELNEVILNDLVPEEKRAEFGLEDKPQKKSGGLKLNLGPKKSSKKSNNKKTQEDKTVQNEIPKHNQKHANSNAQKELEEENTPKKHSKVHKNKQNNKTEKEVAEAPKKGHKSLGKKTKKTHKSQHEDVNQSEIRPIEEIEEIETVAEPVSSSKKSHKSSHHPKRRRTKHNVQNKEIEQPRSIEQEGIEEIEEEYVSEETNEISNFRGETNTESEFNEEKLKSKFEDLVWSEDKFPKK